MSSHVQLVLSFFYVVVLQCAEGPIQNLFDNMLECNTTKDDKGDTS